MARRFVADCTRLTGLVLAIALGASSPATADEEAIKRAAMVPARDGIKLATEIFLPARDGEPVKGPHPAILIRTPYGKGAFAGTARAFAKLGYAAVTQDVRGRFGSGGDFYIYINEAEDGYDTVEWIAAQPWCNGKVGTWGQSYQAATQNALAILRPPHLTAMFVMVGTSNYIEDGAGRGGAFALLHNMAWCFGSAASGKEANADARVAAALRDASARLPEWLLASPLGEQSPLRWTPTYERWYRDWRKHGRHHPYWKQNGYNFEAYHDQYPEVPIFFIGSWYDLFKRGTLKNFTGLATKHPATRLLMGPWPHSVGGTAAGNVDFGSDARISIPSLAAQWFAWHLRGESPDHDFAKEPRVKFFMMGTPVPHKNKDGRMQSGGHWETAETWPPPGFAKRRYYFHHGGRLGRAPPRAGAPPSRFQFDPRNPVPTVGGNIDSGGNIVPFGAQNQVPPADYFASRSTLPLSARADVLTFETSSLEEAVEVAGPISVRLWVSSEAVDTDFTAKLIDVYPPSEDYPVGYAMNLEDGILRMRFRGPDKEELMAPGEVYPITIDLWATANRFEKGHRIRIDLSSSNFPMYDVNPNTGEPIGFHTRVATTVNTIYHDADRPSALLLPVRGPEAGN